LLLERWQREEICREGRNGICAKHDHYGHQRHTESDCPSHRPSVRFVPHLARVTLRSSPPITMEGTLTLMIWFRE
jgi:hypothetical protein